MSLWTIPFNSNNEKAVIEDNDGLESLWERFGSHCPTVRHIYCREFALLDHEFVTPKQMTKPKVTEEALDVAQPNREES